VSRAALLGLVALTGCIDHRAGIPGPQSIDVALVSPQPGDIDHRIADDQRTITVDLTVHDAQGRIDATFDRELQIYVQYLGTLTPMLDTVPDDGVPGPAPLDTVQMANGMGTKTITLPPVFGPTTLWVEDGRNDAPTYATGASPPLWFRDPFIQDIQQPIGETRLDALTDSPLENKQVTVNSSRHGAAGRLVVTSVFSQGYTVSDVACADAAGTPPCVPDAYDHALVFSFSAPTGGDGHLLRQGQAIDGFSGGISEFDGLTEIGFPATMSSNSEVHPEWLPAPAVVDPATWFKPLSNPNGIINFERNEAGLVEVDHAVVCDLDDDYTTFKQWKLDPFGVGGDCSNQDNVLNVITAGVVTDLDPATLVGKQLPRVVGVLRPVELPGFDVWIMYPRSAADLTMP
jgi:hypothetical protein